MMECSTEAVRAADNSEDVGSIPAAPTTCPRHGETRFWLTKDKGKPRWRCGKCNYAGVKRRRRKIKALAVSYKGGRCLRCGYDTCASALEFHHRDPGKKDIQISQKANIAWETIRLELDKCDMLCANCHREQHNCDEDLGP